MRRTLLNQTAVKEYALARAKEMRAHKFEHVSWAFVCKCDEVVRAFIMQCIRTHPSKGKTLK